MRLALVTVLGVVLFVLGGCPGPDAARLSVNDDLRQACPSLADQDIQTLLLIAESERLEGYSEAEAMNELLLACQEAPSQEQAVECSNCGVAVIHQVYSLAP